MPNWLNDAVFYEIYPQSFCDTNGDGIGDIEGIISKLDYVKSLGCNAIWLNPIYDSPFMDAGYDVRNYKKVAERYGTNDDLVRLFDEAHKKGIKILLDLVPGHTSDQNEWFLEAKKAAKSEYSNRYIFTKSVWDAPPQRIPSRREITSFTGIPATRRDNPCRLPLHPPQNAMFRHSKQRQ